MTKRVLETFLLSAFLWYPQSNALNDTSETATVVSAFPFSETIDLSGYTDTHASPSCATGGREAFYKIEAPSAGWLIGVQTRDSAGNVMLSLWRGTPGNLTEALCDRDSGPGVEATLLFNPDGGSDYYVIVEEENASQVGNTTVIFRREAYEQQFQWEQVNADGFGRQGNTGDAFAEGLIRFGDYLYVATDNSLTGAQLWRTTKGEVQSDWEQVNADGFGYRFGNSITGMEVLGDYLYVAVHSLLEGVRVWRSRTASASDEWELAAEPGFGRGRSADNCQALKTFRGYLYGDDSVSVGGTTIWRTSVGASQSDWMTASDPGLGIETNGTVQSMVVFRGQLYVGAFNSATGCQIWRTSEGAKQEDWEPVSTDGFGNRLNQGATAMEVYRDQLYVGTQNEEGGEVWRSGTGNSGSFERANLTGFGVGSKNVNFLAVTSSGLMAGTYHPHGGQIWMATGAIESATDWVAEGALGFGDTHNFSLHGAASFLDERLFISWKNNLGGIEVWRTLEKVKPPEEEPLTLYGFSRRWTTTGEGYGDLYPDNIIDGRDLLRLIPQVESGEVPVYSKQ